MVLFVFPRRLISTRLALRVYFLLKQVFQSYRPVQRFTQTWNYDQYVASNPSYVPGCFYICQCDGATLFCSHCDIDRALQILPFDAIVVDAEWIN